MPARIVTQELVDSAAEALVAEGADPSIVAVQSRIGGGSYSTVKRYLDLWRQQRAEAATAAPGTPPEVVTKGQEFARLVWALAAREAQRAAEQTKAQALADVTAARAEAAQAMTEIARLEAVETQHATTIGEQHARIREIELALADAQALARRVPELEAALATARAESDIARQVAADKAVEAGRLAGEAATLREQIQNLIAAISPAPAAG